MGISFNQLASAYRTFSNDIACLIGLIKFGSDSVLVFVNVSKDFLNVLFTFKNNAFLCGLVLIYSFKLVFKIPCKLFGSQIMTVGV